MAEKEEKKEKKKEFVEPQLIKLEEPFDKITMNLDQDRPDPDCTAWNED